MSNAFWIRTGPEDEIPYKGFFVDGDNSHPRLEFVEMMKEKSDFDNFAGNCSIPDDDALPTVEVLHRYRHRNSGRIYLVSEFILTCDDDIWVDGVLYMSVESGERFVQPLERFKRKMESVT